MELPSLFDSVPGVALDGQTVQGHEPGNGVGVTVGVDVVAGVSVAVGVSVGVFVGAPVTGPSSIVSRSKLVFQSFVVLMVTEEHVPVHPVAMTCCAPTASAAVTVGWPAQVRVTLAEAVPLLYAVSWMSRFGATKLKLALLTLGPLNEMLLPWNGPTGGESHQLLLPQSITPLGYSPVRGRL
jgi:hypothetical protein